MEIRQGNMLRSLRGVQEFLDAHADTLGAVAASGAKKKLDALVTELAGHAAAQSVSNVASKGATQKQRALRQEVRDQMASIARIARAELPGVPEFDALRMPKSTVSFERLHAAAMGMAEAAEKHADVFVGEGLPTDFGAQFRAAADAMLVPIDERQQSIGSQQGATEGLAKTLAAARRTVKVLDTFVRRAWKDNPALLKNWDVVKRPPAKTGKAQGAVAAPAAAIASITPATTATTSTPAAA